MSQLKKPKIKMCILLLKFGTSDTSIVFLLLIPLRCNVSNGFWTCYHLYLSFHKYLVTNLLFFRFSYFQEIKGSLLNVLLFLSAALFTHGGKGVQGT